MKYNWFSLGIIIIKLTAGKKTVGKKRIATNATKIFWNFWNKNLSEEKHVWR